MIKIIQAKSRMLPSTAANHQFTGHLKYHYINRLPRNKLGCGFTAHQALCSNCQHTVLSRCKHRVTSSSMKAWEAALHLEHGYHGSHSTAPAVIQSTVQLVSMHPHSKTQTWHWNTGVSDFKKPLRCFMNTTVVSPHTCLLADQTINSDSKFQICFSWTDNFF